MDVPATIWDAIGSATTTEIGGGNFANVHIVQWPGTKEKSVVKWCDVSDAQKSEVLEKEWKCLQALAGHPNIIAARSAIPCQKQAVLEIEFAPHGDLMSFLQRRPKPLTERQVANVVYQVLDALDYVHSNGFVHRDVKPHNILVVSDKPLHVKLADFGLAKPCDLTNSYWARQNSAGDAAFMAPDMATCTDEQMPVCAQDYVKSDVFALGCTLYFLLTGEAPYPDVDRRLQPNYPFEPQRMSLFELVTPEGINFCRRLMSQNSDDRPFCNEAMQDAWFTRWGSGMHSGSIMFAEGSGNFTTPPEQHQQPYHSRGLAEGSTPLPVATEEEGDTMLRHASLLGEQSFAFMQ